jgi:hypothetical protein
MNAILGFKNLEGEDRENCPCGEELSEHLSRFHNRLMSYVSLSALQEPEESEVRIFFSHLVRDIQICMR